MRAAPWPIVVAALAVSTALWPGPASAQPREVPMSIVTLAGRAEMFRKGAAAWTPAALRAEAGEGDGVRTLAGGRLTLRTPGGQALRLAQVTQLFVIGNDPAAAEGPTRVRLDAGWLWAAVVPGSPAPTRIEVRAGPVTVEVRGTGAGIRMNPDGSVLVRVYHGLAICTGGGAEGRWERTLKQEQELLVPAAGVPANPRRLTREKGEAFWVRWNEEQDHAGPYGGKPPAR